MLLKRFIPLVLVVSCVVGAEAATVLKTTSESDGIVERYYSSGNVSYYGYASHQTMITDEVSGGSGWKEYAVMQFNVGVLAHAADTATLRFYNVGGKADLCYEPDFSGTGSLTGQTEDHLKNIYYAPDFLVDTGTTTGWREFDVTAQVQDALGKGHQWAIFVAKWPSDDVPITIRAWDYADAGAGVEEGDFAPQLVVVPEPASLMMLSAGTIALIRRRRK
jgi:hypothetical protein